MESSDGEILGDGKSGLFHSLQERINTFVRWAQYQPWYIKLGLLDRRVQLAILVLPPLLVLVLIGLALGLQGSTEECVSSSSSFRGAFSSTSSGLPCVPWASLNKSIHSVYPTRYEGAGLDENYCRDPDGTGRLWCYTSLTQNHFDYCSIKQCENVASYTWSQDYRYKPNTDTSCIPEVSVSGVGSQVDGRYEMVDTWANGRGVYRRAQDGGRGSDVCLAWHGEYRHWWLTHCTTVGKNMGYAWLEEDARCPTDGVTWRMGGNDRRLNGSRVFPVHNDFNNCIEFDAEYTGIQVDENLLEAAFYSECRRMCLNNPTCKAISWTPSNRLCSLFHTVVSKSRQLGTISGAHSCDRKVRVGCPSDGVMIDDLCVRFLEESSGICQDGCSRFRAMEECWLSGGYLVEGLGPETSRKLLDYALANHPAADWWTAGSDITDKTRGNHRFRWERSGTNVPLDPELWRNGTPPSLNSTYPDNTHTCVYMARNSSGFAYDVVNCDTSLAKPICSYIVV